jgi:hypothetical protein
VPGLRVESVTVARGAYEVRIHRVLGAPPGAWVEETGWATGIEEDLESALLALHGWTLQENVPAPAGTAFAPYASVPRLAAPAPGTTLFAALVVLGAPPPEVDVSEVTADSITVRWPDASLTRVTFDPLTVQH